MAFALIVRTLKWLLLGFLLLIVGTGISIYRYSFEQATQPADAAIVLGAAVWGNQPSPVFEERIKHAIKLYQQKKVKALVFTGGFGKGQRFSESQIAKQYAINQGIPAQAIFIEQQSKTTLQNLEYTKPIVINNQWSRLLLVSDPLHMKRGIMMAEDLGLIIKPSPTQTSRYQSWQSQLRFLGREVYFYWVYKTKGVF